jgi:hypothetical protein
VENFPLFTIYIPTLSFAPTLASQEAVGAKLWGSLFTIHLRRFTAGSFSVAAEATLNHHSSILNFKSCC